MRAICGGSETSGTLPNSPSVPGAAHTPESWQGEVDIGFPALLTPRTRWCCRCSYVSVVSFRWWDARDDGDAITRLARSVLLMVRFWTDRFPLGPPILIEDPTEETSREPSPHTDSPAFMPST